MRYKVHFTVKRGGYVFQETVEAATDNDTELRKAVNKILAEGEWAPLKLQDILLVDPVVDKVTSAQKALDRKINAIAKKHLNITLAVHNRDKFDFPEVSVVSIRDALEAAYFAGQESGLGLGMMMAN